MHSHLVETKVVLILHINHFITRIIQICNAHISTLLGVQGAVNKKTKQKKTDTTKLVLENLRHKISFEKRFEICGLKTRSKMKW